MWPSIRPLVPRHTGRLQSQPTGATQRGLAIRTPVDAIIVAHPLVALQPRRSKQRLGHPIQDVWGTPAT